MSSRHLRGGVGLAQAKEPEYQPSPLSRASAHPDPPPHTRVRRQRSGTFHAPDLLSPPTNFPVDVIFTGNGTKDGDYETCTLRVKVTVANTSTIFTFTTVISVSAEVSSPHCVATATEVAYLGERCATEARAVSLGLSSHALLSTYTYTLLPPPPASAHPGMLRSPAGGMTARAQLHPRPPAE